MSDAGGKRGRKRVYDAERTRAIILSAAEALFAEHGFAGTSMDAIAAEAGYNKSLLFQYFGDKLSLYTQVLKQADREVSELLARVFACEFADNTALVPADQLRAFLTTVVQTLFDYLLEHPRIVRLLSWEMAAGWQAFAQIAPQFPPEDMDRLDPLLYKAHRAGLLRSDFMPMIQSAMMIPVCQAYLAYLPLYQRLMPEQDLSSVDGLARARKYIVDFIVAGMLTDMPATKTMQEG